jgi:hypothetical protein
MEKYNTKDSSKYIITEEATLSNFGFNNVYNESCKDTKTNKKTKKNTNNDKV